MHAGHVTKRLHKRRNSIHHLQRDDAGGTCSLAAEVNDPTRRSGFSRYDNMSEPPSAFLSRPRTLQFEKSSLDSRVEPRVGGCTSSGQITRTLRPGTAWGLETTARTKLST